MIPITRTWGMLSSYDAVSLSLSPAVTGIPFGVENVVMCFGPFSCMTGFTTGNPHVGSDVKRFRPPQVRLVSASFNCTFNAGGVVPPQLAGLVASFGGMIVGSLALRTLQREAPV